MLSFGESSHTNLLLPNQSSIESHYTKAEAVAHILFLSFYLYLSVYLFIACLSIFLTIILYTYLSVYQSTFLHIALFVIFIFISISFSFTLYLYLSRSHAPDLCFYSHLNPIHAFLSSTSSTHSLSVHLLISFRPRV